MNGAAIFGDQCLPFGRPFGGAQKCVTPRLASVIAAFGMAVGGTSLLCYVLMTRLQNRRENRRPSREGFTDAGNYSGGDGGSISSWLGGDNSALDSSGNPSSDGGGGGDGGGSDGGGGGGD